MNKYLAPTIASIVLLFWAWMNYTNCVRAQPEKNPNLPPGRNLLFLDADSKQWIMLAQTAAEKSSPLLLWRTHKIEYDNAPHGRAQHWATPYLTYLVFLGKANALITGADINTAIENAALLANPLLLILCGIPTIFLLAKLTEPIMGSIGAIIALIPITLNPFLSCQPDHHGIIQVCAILALAFALNATISPRKEGLIASGVFSGILLWISAFNAIPLIGIIAIGAAFTPQQKEGKDIPWEIWAYTTAIVSFITYLLEYTPKYQIILDINNPLYAVCCWATGLLLKAKRNYQKDRKIPWGTLIGCALIFIAPLILATIGKEMVLYSLDKTAKLYLHSLGATAQLPLKEHPPLMVGLVFLTLYACQAGIKKEGTQRFGLLTAILLLGWGLLMTRNTTIAYGGFIIITLFAWPQKRSPALAVLLIPFLIASLQNYGVKFESETIRNAAAESRKTGKTPKDPIILTTPESAIPAAYYFGGKSVGSPYWENWPNLNTVHRYLCLPNRSQTLQLFDKAGINLIFVTPNRRDKFSRELILGGDKIPLGKEPLWESFVLNDKNHPIPETWQETASVDGSKTYTKK